MRLFGQWGERHGDGVISQVRTLEVIRQEVGLHEPQCAAVRCTKVVSQASIGSSSTKSRGYVSVSASSYQAGWAIAGSIGQIPCDCRTSASEKVKVSALLHNRITSRVWEIVIKAEKAGGALVLDPFFLL